LHNLFYYICCIPYYTFAKIMRDILVSIMLYFCWKFKEKCRKIFINCLDTTTYCLKFWKLYDSDQAFFNIIQRLDNLNVLSTHPWRILRHFRRDFHSVSCDQCRKDVEYTSVAFWIKSVAVSTFHLLAQLFGRPILLIPVFVVFFLGTGGSGITWSLCIRYIVKIIKKFKNYRWMWI